MSDVRACPSCGIRSLPESSASRHYPGCRYFGDNSWPGKLESVGSSTARVAVLTGRETVTRRGGETLTRGETVTETPTRRETVTRTCLMCAEDMTGRRSQALYCSRACGQRAHRERTGAA